MIIIHTHEAVERERVEKSGTLVVENIPFDVGLVSQERVQFFQSFDLREIGEGHRSIFVFEVVVRIPRTS